MLTISLDLLGIDIEEVFCLRWHVLQSRPDDIEGGISVAHKATTLLVGLTAVLLQASFERCCFCPKLLYLDLKANLRLCAPLILFGDMHPFAIELYCGFGGNVEYSAFRRPEEHLTCTLVSPLKD